MHSQTGEVEAGFHADAAPMGTPVPCPRAMVPEALVPWTLPRLAAALVMALLPVPLQRAPALISRRRD
jgi:hypothetical protein